MLLKLKYLLLAACGFSFGTLAAAGVFTVLAAVGLIPRFAGKTHTAKQAVLYEELVTAGTVAGGFASVFERYSHIGEALLRIGVPPAALRIGGSLFLAFAGIFAGMFVGCLALAIAEMLDSVPIFARRIGFRRGLGIAVLAMAAGKLAGSLFYFAAELHGTAG